MSCQPLPADQTKPLLTWNRDASTRQSVITFAHAALPAHSPLPQHERQLRGVWMIRGTAVSAVVALLAPIAGIASMVVVAAITVIWRQSRAGPRPAPVLVVGAGGAAAVIATILEGSRQHRRSPPRIVRAHDWAEAMTRLATLHCDYIIGVDAALPPPSPLHDARNRRVTVLPGSLVLERFVGRRPLESIATESNAQRSRDRPYSLHVALIKRAMDLAVAFVLGLLLAPLLVLILILLLLRHEAPFESRIIAGLHGRPVRTWRFRTARRRGDPSEPTWPGRILQWTHLASLPVMWNVANGTFSLIGPRPESIAIAKRRCEALPAYANRYNVKPGLIAWGDLRRAAPSHQRTLEYDLYYASYASLALDAMVVAAATRRLATGVICAISLPMQSGRRTMADWISSSLRKREPYRRRSHRPSASPPRDPPLQSTLLVGAGAGGRLLVKEMNRNPSWGFRPVGFVDDDPRLRRRRVLGLPVLGSTKELSAIVSSLGIDVVVIAVPSATGMTIARLAETARQSAARVLTMPDIGMLLRGEASLATLSRVDVSDVLGRPAVEPNIERCERFIAGRSVLITGAAGSIGQELTRQVAQLAPAHLIVLDSNETGLFDLHADIAGQLPDLTIHPVVASVLNARRMTALLAHYRPNVVFHAAAYKHVPLMEQHPEEAVMINAVGTHRVAMAAAAAGVERFVLVSSDKAVRPSSVMGATKRIAELALREVGAETGLSTCCVRFGNVLGSRGSVIPTFVRQIEGGGPITVTHPEMKRYFMTIPEAASLIIQAGAFGDRNVIYMLDMGEEVSILQLAERMIRLRGLRIGRDIEIVFTGLRPGEKLREELALDSEITSPTAHPKIRVLASSGSGSPCPAIAEMLRHLREVVQSGDPDRVRAAVFAIIHAVDAPAGAHGEFPPQKPPPPVSAGDDVPGHLSQAPIVIEELSTHAHP